MYRVKEPRLIRIRKLTVLFLISSIDFSQSSWEREGRGTFSFTPTYTFRQLRIFSVHSSNATKLPCWRTRRKVISQASLFPSASTSESGCKIHSRNCADCSRQDMLSFESVLWLLSASGGMVSKMLKTDFKTSLGRLICGAISLNGTIVPDGYLVQHQ